jgi:Phosphopantetheine attachment site.
MIVKEHVMNDLFDIIYSLQAVLSREELDVNINLIDDLGFDSITIIQLVVDIESKFNILFSHEDMIMDKLNNISALYYLIFELLEKCDE